MDVGLIQTMGQIAGIGGVAIGAAVLIFRDVIRAKVFNKIGKEHSYRLLRLVTLLIWSIAVLGIIAWVLGALRNSPSQADIISEASTDSLLVEANRLHINAENQSLVFQAYERSAIAGNPIAMGHLASIYHLGSGVEKNPSMSIEWAKQSASKLEHWCASSSRPEPCFAWGLLLWEGIYVAQNYQEAHHWVEFAAGRGYARAYYPLGNQFNDAVGTDKNIERAIYWWRRAADAGNPRAMFSLYKIYSEESFPNHDSKTSIEWLRKAADLKFNIAERTMGLLLVEGKEVTKDTTQGITLLQSAAKSGDSSAQYALGSIYTEGKITNQNIEQGRQYLVQAAASGNAEALNYLGNLYYDGNGIKKNYAKAVDYYRKSADLGLTIAKSNLGLMYARGYGVVQNELNALEWYRKAATDGDSDAQLYLADIYLNGGYAGVKQDIDEAIFWANKAAVQHNVVAYVKIGILYCYKQDYAKAIYWYEKAIEADYHEGYSMMGGMYEAGKGVQIDQTKALDYYKKAIDKRPDEEVYLRSYWSLKHKIAKNETDRAEALRHLEWFTFSTNQWTQYALGEAYARQGDMKKAAKWMKHSAYAGNGCAAMIYASYLYEGIIGQKNVAEAIEWYSTAKDLGVANGSYNLGIIYLEGRDISADVNRGLNYLEQAAAAGSPEALVYLSRLYRAGTLVTRDLIKSSDYLTKAAKAGSIDAKNDLEYMAESPLLSCGTNVARK